MFRFPTPPNTLVTLQIECVSCKETFSLAEDIANKNASAAWRIPYEQSAHIAIHQRPHHSKHLIRPLTRATPEHAPDFYNGWDADKHEPVNCPRCGTDNRNWLRLVYADPPGNFLERQRCRLEKFSLIWIGYFVTAFLLVKLIVREWEAQQWGPYILVFIMIFLAGVIPIRAITGQWRKVREHKIENTYDSTRYFFQRLSPGVSQGILYLFIFVVVIPMFVYILMPQMIGIFKTKADLVSQIDQTLLSVDSQKLTELQTNDPKQVIPLEGALMSLQGALNEYMFLCDSDVIPTMIANLESLKLQNPSPETLVIADNARYSLRRLQIQENAGNCDFTQVATALYTTGTLAPPDAGGGPAEEIKSTLQVTRLLVQENQDPELLALVSSQVATIKKVIDEANTVTPVPSVATLLSTWLKYVGLACLVSVITVVAATEIYINKINHHLPQPVCHSIRNLTRIVIREARHSLEINGNFHRIEWTEAYRNKLGGISLKGCLCPPINGASSEKYVRGMSYFIVSDMWGCVVSAVAKSVRITPSVHQAWDNHETGTNTEINQFFAQQNRE